MRGFCGGCPKRGGREGGVDGPNRVREGAEPRSSLPHSGAIIAFFMYRSVYLELVAFIGGNIPNYQGVFLRGYGGQASYHYGAVGHWSAALGELQGDGIREIWGELSFLPRSRDGEVGQSGSLAFWNEGRNQWMNDAGKAPSGAMNFYASRSTPVVGEVRPVNRAVRYLIRAR